MTRAIVVAAALTLAAASPARGAEQAASGIEIGARLGYAFSAGHLGAPPNGTDNPLGDYVGGQVPLWLDAGYRFNHDAVPGRLLFVRVRRRERRPAGPVPERERGLLGVGLRASA